MDTPGRLKGVGNEVAQSLFRPDFQEGADPVIMPQGLDILLPMDRILQVSQQYLPDGRRVIGVRLLGGIGDHRNLGGVDLDAGKKLGHFLADHPHDGGMEGHARRAVGQSNSLPAPARP